MRLKLTIKLPNLPLTKCWFPIESEMTSVETISDLKQTILEKLDSIVMVSTQPKNELREQQEDDEQQNYVKYPTSPEQVKLEMDGFELLDDYPLSLVLCENDMITLVSNEKFKITTAVSSKIQRKRTIQEKQTELSEPDSKKRKTVIAALCHKDSSDCNERVDSGSGSSSEDNEASESDDDEQSVVSSSLLSPTSPSSSSSSSQSEKEDTSSEEDFGKENSVSESEPDQAKIVKKVAIRKLPLSLGTHKKKQLRELLNVPPTHFRFDAAEEQKDVSDIEVNKVATQKLVDVEEKDDDDEEMNEEVESEIEVIHSQVHLVDDPEIVAKNQMNVPPGQTLQKKRRNRRRRRRKSKATTADTNSTPPSLNSTPAPPSHNISITMKENNIENEPIDYDNLPALTFPPKENMEIAYKILEITSDYTPALSTFKTGKILHYDLTNKKVTLSRCHSPEPSSDPKSQSTKKINSQEHYDDIVYDDDHHDKNVGKFELSSDVMESFTVNGEPQNDSEMMVSWDELIDVRLVRR